eukprot:2196788-Karenia_brevis.AAC.1
MGVQAMRGPWSPVPRAVQRPVARDQQRSSTPTKRAIASAQRPALRDQPTAPRRDRPQRSPTADRIDRPLQPGRDGRRRERSASRGATTRGGDP